MEARCFDGDVAHVSTYAFHEHRERAPHLEQDIHQGRLYAAAELVQTAAAFALHVRLDFDGPLGSSLTRPTWVVDLGCGDGGLLTLLTGDNLIALGYDFAPANVAGWEERGVGRLTRQRDVVAEWDRVAYADVYVLTEVLEHLTDPHGMLRRVRARGAQVVCSSPRFETYESHDACHAWAWDTEGYAALLYNAGFTLEAQRLVGPFQVCWAVPR